MDNLVASFCHISNTNLSFLTNLKTLSEYIITNFRKKEISGGVNGQSENSQLKKIGTCTFSAPYQMLLHSALLKCVSLSIV